MKILSIIPLIALLSSCAALSGKKDDKQEAAESSHRSLSQRMEEKNGYKQDASGNWVPQTDKRSSFETKGESPYFKGNVAKQEYHAGDYTKKSWSGIYERKAAPYQGNIDGSRYQTANRFSGKGARESSAKIKKTNYKTQDYATGDASEGGKKITKQSDAETDKRREVFVTPEVTDWKAQRQMSMEESRSILGR